MIKSLAVFLVLFVSVVSAGEVVTCDDLKSPLGDQAELNYDKLVQFIQCNHFTKIQDVLKGLPLKLRSRYMLVYNSHSRHRDATFDEPRIILEDENAKIIIASAGNPKQINGDNLEIIENDLYDGSDSRFHVIVFPEQNKGAVQFSQENPPLCMGCHRERLSPNWESYPEWPGVYGSGSGAGFAESDHFTAFIDKLKKEKLVDPQDAVLNRYESLDGLLEGKVSVYDLEFRNQSFSGDIGYFNQKRLMKRIQSHPDFEKLQPALAAAAQGCLHIETFFPPAYQSKFKISYGQYYSQIEADTLNHFRGELKTISQLTGESYMDPGDWLFFFSVKTFVPIGYVMKYVMGIDPDEYSVTKDASIYNSHHTLGGMESSFAYYGYESGGSCEGLRSESLKNLSTQP